MIKHIIFDWDDVITRGSKEGYFASFHEALKELGISLDPSFERQSILKHWGNSIPRHFEALLPDRPELRNQACELYEKHALGETFLSQLSIVEGVQETLQKLHGKYILSVATGAYREVLTKTIKKYNIPDVFSVIITADEIENENDHKPAPYMLNEIMKRTNTTPGECVYVGDAANDYRMGINAGVQTVVVLTGTMTREDAEKLGARYILDDMTLLESQLSLLL